MIPSTSSTVPVTLHTPSLPSMIAYASCLSWSTRSASMTSWSALRCSMTPSAFSLSLIERTILALSGISHLPTTIVSTLIRFLVNSPITRCMTPGWS